MSNNKVNYVGVVPSIVNYDSKDVERNSKIHSQYMLNRTRRMFKWDTLPDTIPERNLELLLQTNGHVCVAEHDGKLYAFAGSFGGEPNEYYMPTLYVVSNPYLKISKTYKIGEDCVIIPNDSLHIGLLPLISKYGNFLSKTELTMSMIVTLARSALVIDAEDESELLSAKDYLSKLEQGELGIITRDRLLQGDTVKVQPGATSSASVLTHLIELSQYFKASEFNELGLDANWNAKRETLSSEEVSLNRDSLLPLCDDMLENRKESIEKINKMFGTNINVEFGSTWEINEREIDASIEMLERDAKVDENDGGV